MSAVGSSTPRVDGSAKVRGAAQYTADIEMAGMLHAKALRSPHPHAKLVSIDVSKAAALPGVIAIVTRDDLEGLNPHYGAVVEDQPVLAMDRVRCVGDIVAAVAAEEREIAEEAVELIEVEYEPLPAVFDVVDAAQAGAPIIHEERFETQAAIFREQLNLNAGGNVCSVFRAGERRRGRRPSPRPTRSSRTPTACRRFSTATSSPTWPRRCGSRPTGCWCTRRARTRWGSRSSWRGSSTFPRAASGSWCPTWAAAMAARPTRGWSR